jgi:hypothetical protein
VPAPLNRPWRTPRRPRLRPHAAESVRAVGGLAPSVVEIPFSWIADSLTRKPTPAITKAAVTQQGGLTAHSSASAALVRQYGALEALVTLDTACDADPANLATMLTTYRAVPRPRQPTLTFNLFARTDAEALLLLGVTLAQRVRIVGAPTSTPPGAVNFVVEGIRHTAAVDQRLLVWSTAALIGATTTDPGPWFRIGSSALGGTDVMPF